MEKAAAVARSADLEGVISQMREVMQAGQRHTQQSAEAHAKAIEKLQREKADLNRCVTHCVVTRGQAGDCMSVSMVFAGPPGTW